MGNCFGGDSGGERLGGKGWDREVRYSPSHGERQPLVRTSPAKGRPSNRFPTHASPDQNPSKIFDSLDDFCPEKYWVMDEEAPTCGYCEEEFTLTNRRHHCRLCGDVFHGGACAMKAGKYETWFCFYCFNFHSKHKRTLQYGAILAKYVRDLSRVHDRRFWLSSDSRHLLWTCPDSHSSAYSLVLSEPAVRSIPLAEVRCVEDVAPSTIADLDHGMAIRIVARQRSYIIEAKSLKEHEEWLQGLQCAVYVCNAKADLDSRSLDDRVRRFRQQTRKRMRQRPDRIRSNQSSRSSFRGY